MGKSNLTQQLIQLQISSENISSVLDPLKVLDVITKEFATLLAADTVTLSRLDEATNALVVVSEYERGNWIEAELGNAFALSDFSYTNSLLNEKEIKQFTINDPAIEPSELELLLGYEMKSVLLIPFVKQDNLIGLVEVYNHEEILYEDSDLMVARLLSSTAAVAFENAAYFKQVQQSYLQLKTLHESSITIASSLDLNTILTKLASQLCSLLNVTSVYVSEYNPRTHTYRIIAETFSEFASRAERVSDLGKTYGYIYDLGNEASAGSSGIRVYYMDSPDLEPQRVEHLRQFGGNSVMEIPLLANGTMNAIISVWESRYKRVFTQEEIELCKTIALQASIALENAMLYKQARDELKHRKQLEESLRFKLLHDSLTQIPNRVLFTDRLEQAVKKFMRNGQPDFAVFFIDLDNFKKINDTFGHLIGDQALRWVARCIKEIVRATDTVARYGGDEFLMLVEDIQDDHQANQFIQRIRNKLSQPLVIDDAEIFLSCSIGYTLSTQGLQTSQDFIEGADLKMYSVKLSRSN